MRHWMVGLALFALFILPAAGQTPSTYKAPRSPFKDGKPDLSGIWQANNTANWDIQAHAARQGPVLALGAAFSVPAGLGVVEGDEIPYQPWAAAKKKENAANWLTLDPEIKCYMPGVPRATYMPYPFQIVQTPTHILMAYEFASASRIDLHEQQGREPGRHLDGLVARPLGGRYAGRRCDRASTTRRGSIAPATFTAKRCTSSSAIRRSAATCSSTKSPSRIRRSSRARGRSACRSIAARRRTRSSSNTSA